MFLIVTGLMFYSSQEREKEIWLEKAFKFVLYPFQKGIYYVTTFVTFGTTINELGALRRENDEMQRRLSELATELLQLEQLKAENERLRELLQFKTASTLELIPVEVVARNPVTQVPRSRSTRK